MILSMTCATNWMSSCDTISSPNNRAISKQRSRRDFRWVNSLSSWTTLSISVLLPEGQHTAAHQLCATTRGTTHCSTSVVCYYQRDTENYSFVLQDAAQGFHWNNAQTTLSISVLLPEGQHTAAHQLCATTRGTTHCSTSVVCYYQRDNTLQHISCVLLPEGQHTAAHQLCATTRGTTHCSTSVVCYYQRDNTLQHISCVLLPEGQHTAARQLCATTRGTTHCSTSVVCYYQRDNTLQHVSCVLLPEGQHTAAHQLCATTRETTHCSTSVVCYYQRDNTLQHVSCVLLPEGQHTAAHQLCATTRQHTAARQLCATTRGTTHCSTSVVCYYQRDNTLQHVSCVLLPEGQHTAAHQLCATTRGTTHCSTSVVCYYQRDNTLQHISCVLLPEGQHTAAHQLCATTRGTTHCSTSAMSSSNHCVKHDIISVHLFQRCLLNFLEEHFIAHPTKIIYFSDGAASQYKNRKNFINLCLHREDFQVCCSDAFLYIP